MSLTVGIGKDSRSIECRLAVEPEVYYWAIGPEIEHLYAVTGKLIVRYDTVVFDKDEFIYLNKLASDLRYRVTNKPEYWQEFIGRQTHPEEKNLYSKVSKVAFLEFIDEFEALIREAERRDVAVIFYGD